MDSKTLREKYLDFFKKRGHIEIPSSSLVPENDPTTLFISAGMQPLIPYLLGAPHPQGKRLANSQRCFRALDIAAVGDNRHTTFFEMLGNWSLGDYFKKEQLSWLWQFLTSELALDKDKLYISVFSGYKPIPKDEETAQIWQSLGVANDHIYYYGIDKNWWSKVGTPDQMSEGEIGGPDSEVFYDFATPHNLKFGNKCHPNCECGRFLEIGNSVFIQYKKVGGQLDELPQKNVDFGGGLERLLAAVNNQPDIFKTDLFIPLLDAIAHPYGPETKVIADHIKAATFLINDGVTPSNKLQGYILRRLLRRACVKMYRLTGGNLKIGAFNSIAEAVFSTYDGIQSVKKQTQQDQVNTIINEEIERLSKTLETGLRQIEKINQVTSRVAFDLYQSYGFPFEILEELFLEKGQKINRIEFDEEFKKHQEISKVIS